MLLLAKKPAAAKPAAAKPAAAKAPAQPSVPSVPPGTVEGAKLRTTAGQIKSPPIVKVCMSGGGGRPVLYLFFFFRFVSFRFVSFRFVSLFVRTEMT